MPDRTLPSQPNRKYLEIHSLKIESHDRPIDTARSASLAASRHLESLLETQETVGVVLATGNSQVQFLEGLISSNLDWSRVVFFHLDEYLGIEETHPGSFRYYLQQRVANRIPNCTFHFIQGDAVEPLQECDRYSKLLQQYSLDLCLLGIGDNGHLAFNEPGIADFDDPYAIKLVKLDDKTRQQQINGGFFKELYAVPQYAYTLTIPTICRAKKIICLAPGSHKAGVVKQTLTRHISPDFPATILRTLPQATLYCGGLDLSE